MIRQHLATFLWLRGRLRRNQGRKAPLANLIVRLLHVLEGADALRPIEGGFAEDLCRAWFILTALPVVTHILPSGSMVLASWPAEISSSCGWNSSMIGRMIRSKAAR